MHTRVQLHGADGGTRCIGQYNGVIALLHSQLLYFTEWIGTGSEEKHAAVFELHGADDGIG